MPLRAVFFDLDGTFLDTARDLCSALNHILSEAGRQTLSMTEARPLVSDGSPALIKKGFALEEDAPAFADLRQRLLDHYEQNLNRHTEPFRGIVALIERLHKERISWGIVTNKPKRYALPLMQAYRFASEPVCILCPEDVREPKPHPESLQLACEHAQCSHLEALYIGDHKRDISCAQNAKMASIAACYGYISQSENVYSWKADHYAESAEAIWPIIKQHFLN